MCVNLVIYKNYSEIHGNQNTKNFTLVSSVFKTQAVPYLLSRSKENLTGCLRYLCDKAVVLKNTIKGTPSVTLYVTSTHSYRRLQYSDVKNRTFLLES